MSSVARDKDGKEIPRCYGCGDYSYNLKDNFCENCYDDTTICLECGEVFICETDLVLCSKCMDLFDTDKIWDLNDKNKLCALDFNESKEFRERFRR